MQDIARMNSDNLKEIGVKKFKDRAAIMEEVKNRMLEDVKDEQDVGQQKYSFSSSSSSYSKTFSSPTPSSKQSTPVVKKKTVGESSLLLLTTTGPAAEWHGSKFGLYREAGLHNGVKYYQQLDKGNNGHYMYQYSKEKWYISDVLGENGGFLMNLISSATVPESGWQYWDGKWTHDEGIRVTPVKDMASVLCGDITITVSGEAAKHQSEYAGVFKPTGDMSSGRQLIRNPKTGKFLFVAPGTAVWGVRENITDTSSSIQSGCAPDMCPALPRASYSDKRNSKHWQYSNNGWHDSANIIVKCSTHSH